MQEEGWRLRDYLIIITAQKHYSEEELTEMAVQELQALAEQSGRKDASKIRFEVMTPKEAREAGIHISTYDTAGMRDDQYKLVCMFYRRKEKKDGKTERAGKTAEEEREGA